MECCPSIARPGASDYLHIEENTISTEMVEEKGVEKRKRIKKTSSNKKST